jgi:DNA-directed RNA polymerase specialized sigma24 family protein
MSYFLKATLANMSYEELAEEYGVPIGTIKSRMNRAVTHIRKLAQVGCYHQGPELL